MSGAKRGKCHACGQPLDSVRFGVKLTPVLLIIFDAVWRSGPKGVDGEDLRRLLQRKTGRENVPQALPMNVGYLNKKLEPSGCRIECKRHSDDGGIRWIYSIDRRSFMPGVYVQLYKVAPNRA